MNALQRILWKQEEDLIVGNMFEHFVLKVNRSMYNMVDFFQLFGTGSRI